MSRHEWKIYAGSKYIDSGTIEATSEGEALNLVLTDKAEGKDKDTSYSITVGSSSASSYGDEFLRTAGASCMDDTDLTPSGHSFAPKLMEDIVSAQPVDTGCDKTVDTCRAKFNNEHNFGGTPLGKCPHVFKDTPCGYDADREREFEELTRTAASGCTHSDMNLDEVHPTTGEVHAKCEACGYVDPQGTGHVSGCKAGDHDWLERSEIGYGGPVERVCLDCGKHEALRRPMTHLKSGRMVGRGPNLSNGTPRTAKDDALLRAYGGSPTTEARLPISTQKAHRSLVINDADDLVVGDITRAGGEDWEVTRVDRNGDGSYRATARPKHDIELLEASPSQLLEAATLEKLRNKLASSLGVPAVEEDEDPQWNFWRK